MKKKTYIVHLTKEEAGTIVLAVQVLRDIGYIADGFFGIDEEVETLTDSIDAKLRKIWEKTNKATGK